MVTSNVLVLKDVSQREGTKIDFFLRILVDEGTVVGNN